MKKELKAKWEKPVSGERVEKSFDILEEQDRIIETELSESSLDSLKESDERDYISWLRKKVDKARELKDQSI